MTYLEALKKMENIMSMTNQWANIWFSIIPITLNNILRNRVSRYE